LKANDVVFAAALTLAAAPAAAQIGRPATAPIGSVAVIHDSSGQPPASLPEVALSAQSGLRQPCRTSVDTSCRQFTLQPGTTFPKVRYRGADVIGGDWVAINLKLFGVLRPPLKIPGVRVEICDAAAADPKKNWPRGCMDALVMERELVESNIEHLDTVDRTRLVNRRLYFVWSLPPVSGTTDARPSAPAVPRARSTTFEIVRESPQR
jgi:hypothetical protein